LPRFFQETGRAERFVSGRSGESIRVGKKQVGISDIRPSYTDELKAVFAVAKHFTCSPDEVLNRWSMPLFLDALEAMQVEAEITYRIHEAQEV
jgi:hypothetical protein